MVCSLCNAIESRGDKHQPWCPKFAGIPTQVNTAEFQQSIKRYADMFIRNESPEAEENFIRLFYHCDMLKLGDSSEPHLAYIIMHAAMIMNILERELAR